MTKDNVLTYSYKGLAALIYSLFRKKDKIHDLFFEQDVFEEEYQSPAAKKRQKDLDNDIKKETFQYKVKGKNGKVTTSTFDAYNIEQARNYLTNEGYDLVSINPVKKSSININLTLSSPIKTAELSFAITQISTYLKAGISLIDAFRILAKQAKKKEVRKIYDMVVYDLLSGESLSDAFERQPKVFPKLLTNMVRSAELTGDLPSVLDDMADYYTVIDKTKKELKGAMTYPTIVFIMAIAVIVFVLKSIVPQYVEMFSSWSDELPKVTLMTMAFSDFLQNNLMQMIIILIMILLLYIYLFRNVKSFKYMMQYFYLHIPVVKDIIIHSEISMFAKTFASLLNHGVFITDSMDVLIKVSDNEIYKEIIEKTVRNLNKGGKISDAFRDNPYIPIVAYEMIVTGETTGKLGTMMEKVADYYQNLYRNSINQIKTLVEPALIVMLTFTVGLIIISIIVPMFDMYKAIS